MKFPKWALAALLCLSLTACGLLNPHQQAEALQVIEQMRANGTITAEQFEALRQTILDGGQASFWQQVGTILASAGLAWLGVRSKLPIIGRGAPTQVVGLPADKVKA